eukprot:TRINITY_DN5549_c0_g1_i1.p1 TRINITY_DN5549_c0_g1~~TRINITY_DN5549_c0_g1_i1.p1  ORF type:complete len:863 (+),score=242.22 TRINITY_DN5549_c0_g1_i1:85-2589(+)
MMVQQLAYDAEFLLGAKGDRPRPTLVAQREKIQEIEKAAAQKAGTNVAMGGDTQHRRATEQAREAVVTRGVVEVSPSDHPRFLDPDGDLDQELHRRHAERIATWLEKAKQNANTRGQRLYWKHLVTDFRATNTGLVERVGVMRSVIGQQNVVKDSQLIAYEGQAPQWGAASTAKKTTLPLDWRAQQYSSAVQNLPAVDDTSSAKLQVHQLRQLSNMGPNGERPEHLKTATLEMWDTASRILEATSTPCEAGLSPELARVASCKELLEEGFAVFLNSEHNAAAGRDILKLAEVYSRSQQCGGTSSDVEQWVIAYLCLRAGDIKGLISTLTNAGDAHAALAAESHWPAVRRTGSGSMALVPKPQQSRQLREFSDYELSSNPYKHAVRLILSRAATAKDVERVRAALLNTPALRFAQDHVWLHLSLINCVAPPPELSSTQDLQQAPYSLKYYVSVVENVPPSELSTPLDPLLYCKVMLWSQCYAKAIAAFLPPTCLDDLVDFGIEGLHLALMLTRHGLLADNAAMSHQIQTQLEEYVVKLIPHDATAGLYYLRLLPEVEMQRAFTSVCMNRAACEKLLGTASPDGTVNTRNSAAASAWHPSTCGKLARLAADTARERGSVQLAVELYLISIHHVIAAEGAGGSAAVGAAVRELLSFVNPKISHAIEAMEEAGNLNRTTQDVLQAGRLVFSHFQVMSTACERTEGLPLRTFEQLYWAAVLCWNVNGHDVARAWQAYSSLDILPRGKTDVPRLVEEVNYRCDAGTVRKVVHITVTKVLDMVYQAMVSEDISQHGTGEKARLLEIARAIISFQSQLRIPPATKTATRLSQRRQLLSQLGL